MNTPKNKLEEVARLYADNQIPADYPDYFCRQDLQAAFIAGAEWQKEQMLKDAVEGEIQMRYSGGLCAKTIRTINEGKFKFGDKVRIIIVKEEK